MSIINDIIKSAVNNVQSNKEEFNAEEWGKGKQQDREFAYNTQDEMATKITESGELYKTYLNVQSKFPTYSVGNALLVTAQNPKATQLKDAEGWKKDNINFAGKPNKIIILEQGDIYERDDGTEAQSYNPKNVFDISDMRVKRKLNTIPYQKESIMKAVTSMAQFPIDVVENTFNGKLVTVNENKRTIEVSEKAEVEETIQGLVREIASIDMGTTVDTELNRFKNESVSYMICKRYGISTKTFNFEKIPEELKQIEPQDIKAELKDGAKCFEILAEGMDQEIGVPNKSKINREYER